MSKNSKKSGKQLLIDNIFKEINSKSNKVFDYNNNIVSANDKNNNNKLLNNKKINPQSPAKKNNLAVKKEIQRIDNRKTSVFDKLLGRKRSSQELTEKTVENQEKENSKPKKEIKKIKKIKKRKSSENW